MKCFHETEYTVYSEKVTKDIKILALGDLHFSNLISFEWLKWLVERIEKIDPDYVAFSGDMIDSIDDINLELLKWFWKRISRIVNRKGMGLISLGSHDNWKYTYNSDGTINSGYWSFPKELVYELNNIDNIRVLDNESYGDNRLFATGYTQSFNYYYPNGVVINKDKKHPLLENEKLNEIELSNLINRTHIPDNVPSILLVHAPTYMFSDNINIVTSPYDFISSSHNHNLLVPPIANEFWTSTTGIVNPERRWFSELNNGRNTFRTYQDKVVINEPLTTFSRCTGWKVKANAIYPVGLTIINLTNNPEYKPLNSDTRIDKRMRYTR